MSCLIACFVEPKQKKRSKESSDTSEFRKLNFYEAQQAQLREEIDKKNMFHKSSAAAGGSLPPRLGSNISEKFYEEPTDNIERGSWKKMSLAH